jgi:hypothetical protein
MTLMLQGGGGKEAHGFSLCMSCMLLAIQNNEEGSLVLLFVGRIS